MTLGERVYIYCERGLNEALWAEPINVISNAGFFLAALIFWQLVLWRPPEKRSADHYLFVALVFAICFGSVAFHVYADRGTELADVVPIALFMLVYLGFALNRFLTVPPGWTVFLVALFAGLIGAAGQIQCWEGGIGFAGYAPDEAKTCMNGSVAYLPALGALIVISMLVAERRHKAAPYLLAATLIFAASVLLRSLDMAYCQSLVVEGRNTGTHFLWHLLNALVLFLLMRASLETETKPAAVPAEEPVKDTENDPASEPEPEKEKPAAQVEPSAKEEPAVTEEPEAKPTVEEKAGEPEAASQDEPPEKKPAKAAAKKKSAKDEAAKGEGSKDEAPEKEAAKEAAKDESPKEKAPKDGSDEKNEAS